jgi:hypothetical protein
VLQLFPLIHTTLAIVVMITTLHQPFQTQTACGLCVLSSSSNVHCVPSMQSEVATIVVQKTFMSSWFSSAPLRIFAFTPLAPWRQTELGSCMNPLLSQLSMLAGQRTFLGGCHSFRAFFMATPPGTTSTIPYKYAPRQKQVFKFGCANGASKESRRGSYVYEINTWLWNFGRPQPRVGDLSVAKTERIRRKSRSETSRRAWETRKARKRAAEADSEAEASS